MSYDFIKKNFEIIPLRHRLDVGIEGIVVYNRAPLIEEVSITCIPAATVKTK